MISSPFHNNGNTEDKHKTDPAPPSFNMEGTILTLDLLEKFYELINEKFKDYDREELFDDNSLTVYNRDDEKLIRKARSDEINPVESFIFLLKENLNNLVREDSKKFEEILRRLMIHAF